MYTFLKENNDTHNAKIYAVDANRIETLRLAQTYDRFGQLVGTYNACDSVELNTQSAVDVAQQIADELETDYTFKIGDIVNGYDNSDIFNDVEDRLENECTDNEDYTLCFETVKGFTYFDGNNWKTITVEMEHDEPGYKAITDQEEIKKLSEALENMQFVEEKYGVKTYETEDYTIEESAYQSAWESYSFAEK